MIFTNPFLSTEKEKSFLITYAKPYCEEIFAIDCIINTMKDNQVYEPFYSTELKFSIDDENKSCCKKDT